MMSRPRFSSGSLFSWAAGLSAALLLPPGVAAAQQGSTAKAEVLVKRSESWNGKPYTAYPKGTPELTVLRLTIAPGAALPWHTHPFPNAGYVLSGALTIHDRDSGKQETFRPGQAFTESVDDVHRGVAGDKGAVVLLVYAGIRNQPTSVPVAGQPKEY
ncbi:cupin domain-containing protein [Rhizosaccharibacter radicis]|uniref:Cupin domain-containing protein n=1 Tax=Rhizosaccharibacter radicis TaxID=2782605 RepID=A0ABT1W285_9PROT|nr:cupin domain-containing protein [Acetobacteraceae bacterium KSS12]